MSDRKQLLRTAGRASAGLVVTIAAAGAVLVLGTVALPTVERTPPVVEVDTTDSSTQRLVCGGSFSVLGADASRADVAIPVGEPQVTVTGDPSTTGELQRGEPGGVPPVTLSGPADELLAAAQSQQVVNEAGRGLTTSACGAPVNDQWLLGGKTVLGVATTLSLGNPGEVPATAEITVYDENGQVSEQAAAAVRVSPQSEITVSVNGYAPDRERIAVHVSSTGAPVTASLGVTHVIGLEPFAASSVTRQIEPETRVVVPGVANVEDLGDNPTHSHEEDEYPVLVRVLAPEGQTGQARVAAVDAAGSRTELGTLDFTSGAVAELPVTQWPEGANAVVIDADVPVIAGVLGTSFSPDRHDYGWFAPAPELRPGEPAAAAIVPDGQLVLVNPGSTDAEVEIGEFVAAPEPEEGSAEAGAEEGDAEAEAPAAPEPQVTVVPAGAAVVVSAPAHAVITSSEPIYAGVRAHLTGDIDGYPILAESQREGALRVYVR